MQGRNGIKKLEFTLLQRHLPHSGGVSLSPKGALQNEHTQLMQTLFSKRISPAATPKEVKTKKKTYLEFPSGTNWPSMALEHFADAVRAIVLFSKIQNSISKANMQ